MGRDVYSHATMDGMRLHGHHILPIGSFIILTVLMGLFSVHTLTSIYQDIGRHITVGRIIWETGNIPNTNLFSFTNRDFPFVNHHWFGGLMLFLGDRLVGLKGLIAVKSLLVAFAFSFSLAAAWRPRVASSAVIIGLASIFTMVERTDVRPEIISFAFLGWFLFVLYRSRLQATSYKLLWTLPFAQLVWVNTHIYFFMGPLIWLAFLIGKVFSAPNIKSGLRSLFTNHYPLITVALALATLVNPSGYHGAFYPLTMWSNYGYSIVENQTPFFLHDYGYPAMTTVAMFITIVLVVVSFVINRKHFRQNIDGALLMLITAGLSLSMVRNFPLVALCAIPIFLRNIDESGWYIKSRTALAFACAILALISVSVVTNQIYDQAGLTDRKFGLIVPSGPQQPIDFFRTAGIRGPLFNNFDVGSFLIWKLPEEPVFIDGRPEAYPADFIQNIYIPMQEDKMVWNTQSQRYGINTVFWNYNDITPWSQAFVKRIVNDPQWVQVYRGQSIMILVKNIPANSAIISKYRLN